MAVSYNIKIEKEGNIAKFTGKTKARDFRNWLNGHISKDARENKMESVMILQECLRAYNYYEPMQVGEVDIKSWRGKSGVEVVKGLDKLILIRHQKSSKNAEPQEKKIEIEKEELVAVINSIRELSILHEQIETKDLAMQYCLKLDIKTNDKGEGLFSTNNFWEKFFNFRRLHNRVTTILAGLESLGVISYSDGKTKLLDKNISVQLILE